tara:strand:+ start:310 stop:456 length:147 start_codon:yes stop_codon:yes gene_type:complete
LARIKRGEGVMMVRCEGVERRRERVVIDADREFASMPSIAIFGTICYI